MSLVENLATLYIMHETRGAMQEYLLESDCAQVLCLAVL